MDWHKLQHTLYNLDPTDPKKDLAKLQESARKPAEDIPTIDYIVESVDVPKGSMPLAIDNVSDFAKLAGIESKKQINEDPIIPQGFAAGWQAGKKLAAPDSAERFIKDKFSKWTDPKDKNKKDKNTPKIKGSVSSAQIAKMLNVSNVNAFVQAVNLTKRGETITNQLHYRALAEGFVRLMQMDPQKTQQAMTLLKRVQADESVDQSSLKKPSKEHISIKEELYRRLASKK